MRVLWDREILQQYQIQTGWWTLRNRLRMIEGETFWSTRIEWSWFSFVQTSVIGSTSDSSCNGFTSDLADVSSVDKDRKDSTSLYTCLMSVETTDDFPVFVHPITTIGTDSLSSHRIFQKNIAPSPQKTNTTETNVNAIHLYSPSKKRKESTYTRTHL